MERWKLAVVESDTQNGEVRVGYTPGGGGSSALFSLAGELHREVQVLQKASARGSRAKERLARVCASPRTLLEADCEVASLQGTLTRGKTKHAVGLIAAWKARAGAQRRWVMVRRWHLKARLESLPPSPPGTEEAASLSPPNSPPGSRIEGYRSIYGNKSLSPPKSPPRGGGMMQTRPSGRSLPSPTAAAHASSSGVEMVITLDGCVGEFEWGIFRQDVSRLLDLSPPRLRLVSVREGSIILHIEILGPDAAPNSPNHPHRGQQASTPTQAANRLVKLVEGDRKLSRWCVKSTQILTGRSRQEAPLTTGELVIELLASRLPPLMNRYQTKLRYTKAWSRWSDHVANSRLMSTLQGATGAGRVPRAAVPWRLLAVERLHRMLSIHRLTKMCRGFWIWRQWLLERDALSLVGKISSPPCTTARHPSHGDSVPSHQRSRESRESSIEGRGEDTIWGDYRRLEARHATVSRYVAFKVWASVGETIRHKHHVAVILVANMLKNLVESYATKALEGWFLAWKLALKASYRANLAATAPSRAVAMETDKRRVALSEAQSDMDLLRGRIVELEAIVVQDQDQEGTLFRKACLHHVVLSWARVARVRSFRVWCEAVLLRRCLHSQDTTCPGDEGEYTGAMSEARTQVLKIRRAGKDHLSAVDHAVMAIVRWRNLSLSIMTEHWREITVIARILQAQEAASVEAAKKLGRVYHSPGYTRLQHKARTLARQGGRVAVVLQTRQLRLRGFYLWWSHVQHSLATTVLSTKDAAMEEVEGLLELAKESLVQTRCRVGLQWCGAVLWGSRARLIRKLLVGWRLSLHDHHVEAAMEETELVADDMDGFTQQVGSLLSRRYQRESKGKAFRAWQLSLWLREIEESKERAHRSAVASILRSLGHWNQITLCGVWSAWRDHASKGAALRYRRETLALLEDRASHGGRTGDRISMARLEIIKAKMLPLLTRQRQAYCRACLEALREHKEGARQGYWHDRFAQKHWRRAATREGYRHWSGVALLAREEAAHLAHHTPALDQTIHARAASRLSWGFGVWLGVSQQERSETCAHRTGITSWTLRRLRESLWLWRALAAPGGARARMLRAQMSHARCRLSRAWIAWVKRSRESVFGEIIVLQGALLCTRRGLIVSLAYWRAFGAWKRQRHAPVLESLLHWTLGTLEQGMRKLEANWRQERRAKEASAKSRDYHASALVRRASPSRNARTRSELWQLWRQHAERAGNTASADACGMLQWTQRYLTNAMRGLQANREWQQLRAQHGQWAELHYAYRMMASTLHGWRAI